MISTIKNSELCRILSMSLCFMLLFASDTTMLNMQKTVISSIANDQPDFHIEGYTMAGVLYTLFAISVWFGSYVNYALGAKLIMILSAVGYLYYIVSFITESEWVIFSAVVVNGVAAGTLWPAQGCYMIENSSPETTSRNVGIFWFMFTSSNMIGNVCVYAIFYGKKYIDKPTRRTAIYFLAGINILAILAFMLLPKSKSNHTNYEYGPIKTLKKSFSILTSKRMMWMAVAFSYAGLQQSFGSGIYSPSVGFTLAFGDSAKQLVALSGIFMSIGSLLGALSPIFLSECIRRNIYTRKLIVVSGITAQLLCYFITFFNLPDNAVYGDTSDEGLIQPRAELAMLGSILLSFGDSCLATQIYSFIGDFYRLNSAEACALYKFVKGALVAISFYSCNHLGLHTQVTILAVMAVIGCMGFCMADQQDTTCETDQQDNTDQQKTEGKE